MQLIDALPNVPQALLSRSEGRVAITKDNPLLFAAIYLPHHLKADDGSSTLAQFHLDLVEYAKTWKQPSGLPRQFRDCFIAPRNSGKTTWFFLILPLWAAAHGHKKFVAAFSDSARQAEDHLMTFKTELTMNARLRADFPDLCEPAKGTNVGRSLMDNRNQIMQSNGFVFMARGADTASLGMKIGSQRPDVLLFDDIEPGESNYGAGEMEKRRETLIADLFALNVFGRVCIVGTTTMPNSLMDQIRKVHEGLQDGLEHEDFDQDLRWVLDQNIQAHYYPAIYERDGVEVSFWPERFSYEFLDSIRHTREFAKNYMNRPISAEAGYWTDEDVVIEPLYAEDTDRTIITVDPAVTTKKASDYTGIAVLTKQGNTVYVQEARQIKATSDVMKDEVEALIQQYKAKVVLVESNQGGDLWKQVFGGVSAKVRTNRVSDKKEHRAARAFDIYRKGHVKHTKHLPMLEEQMYSFPRVAHDDLVDAVVSGVLYFLGTPAVKVAATTYNYL